MGKHKRKSFKEIDENAKRRRKIKMLQDKLKRFFKNNITFETSEKAKEAAKVIEVKIQ